MHGYGRVPFPHFERFGGSQPWKPDSADLVPPKAVVEKHDCILIHGLRLRVVNHHRENYATVNRLTLKSSRKSRAGSNPGLLSTAENFICCPVSTPRISTDAFSYERGSVDASRWIIKSYSVVGCAFRIYCHDQLTSRWFPRRKRTDTSLKL